MTTFEKRNRFFFFFQFCILINRTSQGVRRQDDTLPPEPLLCSRLSLFFSLFVTLKSCCLTYKLIYKLHFSMNPFHCGSGPLNTFIRAKNSIANETQRSSALPHRETGCLPIVHAAWERRGSSAQPGPAHLSRLKADPV